MIQITRVKDLMNTAPIVVQPETGVHEAVAILLEQRLSGLPVTDEQGALVGIVTEQDCLRAAFRNDYYGAPGRTVAEAMTPSPETLDADDDIMIAIDLFLDRPFRRFPVVRDGTLVGILSRRDALRLLKLQT